MTFAYCAIITIFLIMPLCASYYLVFNLIWKNRRRNFLISLGAAALSSEIFGIMFIINELGQHVLFSRDMLSYIVFTTILTMGFYSIIAIVTKEKRLDEVAKACPQDDIK